jgi:hypothetical protein
MSRIRKEVLSRYKIGDIVKDATKPITSMENILIYRYHDGIEVYVDGIEVLKRGADDFVSIVSNKDLIITEHVDEKSTTSSKSETMEKPKRFKVGDIVTLKFYKDCITHSGRIGYYFRGDCQGYRKAKIKSYGSYVNSEKCWDIDVEILSGPHYTMLESEMQEYIDDGFRSPDLKAEVFKSEVIKESKFISPKLK